MFRMSVDPNFIIMMSRILSICDEAFCFFEVVVRIAGVHYLVSVFWLSTRWQFPWSHNIIFVHHQTELTDINTSRLDNSSNSTYMEHLFAIPQSPYFAHPFVGAAFQTDKCKTTCACGSGSMNQLGKKETFTQPLTKASSITVTVVSVMKEAVTKEEHSHDSQHTHDNTSSGFSDLQQQPQQSQSPVTKGKAALTSSTAVPSLVPSTSLDSSNNSSHPARPTYVTLPAQVADDLVIKTQIRVQHALHQSSFLMANQHAITKVPEFSLMDDDLCTAGDIGRGDLVGHGGFADVYAVEIRSPERLCHYTKGQKYVVKHLNSKLYDISSTTIGSSVVRKLHLGAKDMVLESHYLAALNHPNIISLAGTSMGGLDAYETTQRTDAYFMILPRLTCTLSGKISAWKRQYSTTSHAPTGGSSRGWWRRRRTSPTLTEQDQVKTQFLCERLNIIIDLCKALEYIHGFRIMHRGKATFEESNGRQSVHNLADDTSNALKNHHC
jgi:hypothetical protein